MNTRINPMMRKALDKLDEEINKRLSKPKKPWAIKTLRQSAVSVMTELTAYPKIEAIVTKHAGFVRQQTQKDSPLKQALVVLLKRYRTKALKSRSANASLGLIRDSVRLPFFRLEQIVMLREAIHKLLYEISERINDETTKLFEAVSSECRSIERRAAGKPIDPCWFVVKLASHTPTNQAEDSQDAHFLLGSSKSREHLRQLSLFTEWLRELPASKTKRTKPGRKSDPLKRENELKIYQHWKSASHEISLVDFAADYKYSLADIQKLLDRCRKHIKRNNKKNVS